MDIHELLEGFNWLHVSGIKHTIHGDANITDDDKAIKEIMNQNFDIKRRENIVGHAMYACPTRFAPPDSPAGQIYISASCRGGALTRPIYLQFYTPPE